MALPTTLTSATMPAQNYFCGLFKSSEGAYYAVVTDSGGLRVYKATDPSSSWSAQTAPTTNSSVQTVWASQDGDLLHIVSYESTAGTCYYHRWDMFDDAWDVNHQTIDSPKDAPASTDMSCAIASHPLVALYTGDQDSNMGTKYDRVDYATRNISGTWSTPTQAFGASGDTINYRGASIVPGTGEGLHLFCTRDSDSNLLGRTLRSGGTLSTTIVNGDAATNTLLTNGVSFDDAGTQRVLQGFKDSGTAEAYVWRMTESSGDVADVDTVTISTANDADDQNATPVMSLAVDGTTVHVVWSHDTDFDLFHDQAATPQASGDWGTDSELDPAATINRISCNIYNRNGVRVLAMVYDNAGTIYYDEESIDVTPTNLSDVKFPQQSSYIGPFEI